MSGFVNLYGSSFLFFLFCNLNCWASFLVCVSFCSFKLQVICFYTDAFPVCTLCSSGASLLSSTDCASQKQRRWPEDIAWHPDGNCLFSAYSADGGDSQISVLDLNRTQGVRLGLGLFFIYWN